MLTGNPGHLKSFDYIGLHRYSLTLCTHTRRPCFGEPRRVDLVLQQILRAATEQGFAIVAYCFMPDHVHLLIEGQSEIADYRRFIKLAKQLSGFYYKQEYGEQLWQRYGFEHVLRDDEATLSVARYILENPLRAGLVWRVEDHPYIGSTIYSVAELLTAVQMMPVTAKSR